MIIADLHTHTLFSGHALATFHEMVSAAIDKTLLYLAITDHGPSLSGSANGIYFRSQFLVPRQVGALNVLFGCEANIVNEHGELDLSAKCLSFLDIVLAGFHSDTPYSPGDRKTNTKAIIQAVKNKNVDIISHPENPHYPISSDEFVKALSDYNKIMEVNNTSLMQSHRNPRSGGEKNLIELLEFCEKRNVYIVVTSDAHDKMQVGDFENAKRLIGKIQFPQQFIINNDESKLKNYLNTIKKRKASE